MKTRLRFVRHGDASTSSADDADPGLSVLGIRQSMALSGTMAERPLRLVTSPMIRARETAMPLAGAFGLERVVDPNYGELPWRDGQTVVERASELNQTLGARWSDLDPGWRAWRARLIERVLSESGDIVVVSHFVAINVLVGLATDDDRTLIVRPANTSVTEFTLGADGALKIVSLGTQIPAAPSSQISPVKGFSS